MFRSSCRVIDAAMILAGSEMDFVSSCGGYLLAAVESETNAIGML